MIDILSYLQNPSSLTQCLVIVGFWVSLSTAVYGPALTRELATLAAVLLFLYVCFFC